MKEKTPVATKKPVKTEVKPTTNKKDTSIVKDAPEKKKIINVYHVSQIKETKQWQVKLGNGAKAIKLFSTQAEANEYAKALSKNNDRGVLLHSKKGTIRKS